MNNFPTSAIDICVAVIFAISALLAFSRGAVRETLGIGSWIGAAIATVYGFQYVRSIASNLIDHKLIADAAAGIVIFVLALITCTIIAQFLAGRIQRSRMGALDRTLGIVFGLFRGAILVCLAYMLFIWAVEKDDRPDWVDQALTMPYIIHGADMIQSIIPNDTLKDAESRVKATGQGIQQLNEAEQNRLNATKSIERATGTNSEFENSDITTDNVTKE